MVEMLPVLAGGLALGALHSLEPDHVAAMATLAGRGDGRRAAQFAGGALWGLGHGLALAGFGAALVWVGLPAAEGLEHALEGAVGVLLVGLGLARLRGALGPRHAHGPLPLWIGALHGLAGSGGLLLLAPAFVLADVGSYLLYLAAFGLGGTLAMGACLTGLGSLAARLGPRFAACAGFVSIAVGLVWLL